MLIGFAKAVLIVLIFMRLRPSGPLVMLAFAAGFFWLLIMQCAPKTMEIFLRVARNVRTFGKQVRSAASVIQVVAGDTTVGSTSNNRADLWPTVAMIGSLCGFGAIMSFFCDATQAVAVFSDLRRQARRLRTSEGSDKPNALASAGFQDFPPCRKALREIE